MEDFGFKLQNIKNRYGFKKIAKVVLLLLSIIFAILILAKIIKILSNDSYDGVDNVPLVKSQVEAIKRLPEKEGGLVVDNLDISVYDVIDNNEDTDLNPVVKKTKQNINLKENINDNILLEQDLLTQKINDISQSDEPLQKEKSIEIKQSEIYSTKKIEEPVKASDISQKPKANIKINNNKKKPTTNVNDLKKLGNESLIRNLKEKKDIKPGTRVQLLALKSRDGLVEYWEKLNTKYSKLFVDKNYYIEKVNLNNTSTIYRLQIGNFKDKNSANDFCKEYIKITNKNKVDCIVVKD